MADVTKVQDGYVVSLEYTLTIDGEEIDSSIGGEPLEFLQGAGNIIPGLEKALYGMTVGQSKTVVVSPEEGYGEFDEEAMITVPRSEFPKEIPLELGLELEMNDEDGNPMSAFVAEIGKDEVTLDLNHPLAGDELHFDVKIVGLRPATDEELEHGHVHGEEDDEEE